MRADHVGAYGYGAARTPVLDELARDGVRFDRAFAAAPITLTSHASLLTGLYPPGHGARHNGVAIRGSVDTLATSLQRQGFVTGAFVAAFPLDRRFGLARGFDVYGDRMPRGSNGRLANERPADAVVDEAIAWLSRTGVSPVGHRFFLWVHLFEPHAPYGDPVRDAGRTATERYDAEIATADRAVGRLLASLGADAAQTLVVLASDHGEAFGEHGETGHSVFVYDTTLRVALIVRGPGVGRHRVVADPVSLIDVVPTVTRLLGTRPLDGDGIDLGPAMTGQRLVPRALYAESFAPLLDFGWSSLRTVREGRWKAIAAPRPELYDVEADPAELENVGSDRQNVRSADLTPLLRRIEAISGPELPAAAQPAGDAAARLGSLGYVQGGKTNGGARPDPKDRRGLASRIAAVTSGEVNGDAALAALQAIIREDPRNGQMQLRLGDELLGRGRAADAGRHFTAAVAAGVPSADPYLGLAVCQAQGGRIADAIATLESGARVETDNAVVLANLGLLRAQAGLADAAVTALRRAVTLDPDFHEARFDLSRVLARAGRREEALAEASALLQRLPATAPQRPEVERLVAALRQ
jgi:choline-sulfatase